jgi:4-diphosphocytidyl-2-C-methyl-D-erythritol kinase
VTGSAPGRGGSAAEGWAAPAKLTLSLRVTGVRSDGYHLLESEMVTLDLADTLVIDDAASGGASGLTVETEWPGGEDGWRDPTIGPDADNLVTRALAATGRAARVHLVKRIPPGAGLGGGSADAAAVLRWAGCTDVAVAAALGADVPFCVTGGRALVTGIGEQLHLLPYEERSFVLLLPPFGVDTAAVYRAYDAMAADGSLPAAGTVTNELEAAALAVEPRLLPWRHALEEATGRSARLAGSGSTWFVEGTPSELGLAGQAWLTSGGLRAPLVSTRTSPAVG